MALSPALSKVTDLRLGDEEKEMLHLALERGHLPRLQTVEISLLNAWTLKPICRGLRTAGTALRWLSLRDIDRMGDGMAKEMAQGLRDGTVT